MDEITIRGTRKQANLQVWSQRVAECQKGRMPVAQWCESNSISRKTYYRWQKKVFEAMAEERREEPRFAEVRVQQPENGVVATVRIGSAAVEVYTGADAELWRLL